jgi:hypothetical protein
MAGPERVWFLRQEAGWLRPVYDNAAAYLEMGKSLSLESRGLDVQPAFARALLSPGRILAVSHGFGNRLSDFYSLAIEVVGERAAYQMLADLQKEAPPPVRSEICRLVANIYTQCDFSDCPQGSLYPAMTASNTAELRKLRHGGEEASVSAERVAAAMRSDAAKREATHRELRVLACNVDAAIKHRARLLLHQYSPADPTITCVACR